MMHCLDAPDTLRSVDTVSIFVTIAPALLMEINRLKIYMMLHFEIMKNIFYNRAFICLQALKGRLSAGLPQFHSLCAWN